MIHRRRESVDGLAPYVVRILCGLLTDYCTTAQCCNEAFTFYKSYGKTECKTF